MERGEEVGKIMPDSNWNVREVKTFPFGVVFFLQDGRCLYQTTSCLCVCQMAEVENRIKFFKEAFFEIKETKMLIEIRVESCENSLLSNFERDTFRVSKMNINNSPARANFSAILSLISILLLNKSHWNMTLRNVFLSHPAINSILSLYTLLMTNKSCCSLN